MIAAKIHRMIIKKTSLLRALMCGFLFLFLSYAPGVFAATDWDAVDSLVADDQYTVAHEKVLEYLEAARSDQHIEDQTRALVEITKLHLLQNEQEKAALFLKEQMWPDDQKSKVILSLFYAHALDSYLSKVWWGLSNREAVAGEPSDIPLTDMTMAQLVAEIEQAYWFAWEHQALWAKADPKDYLQYFRPGNYPESISGSFRDTLTYLWVRFLGVEHYWGVAHSNQRYELDFDSLLSGPSTEQKQTFNDKQTHPLQRISLLLHRLGEWHWEHNRPEAALEVSRVLIKALRQYIGSDERKQLLQSLIKENNTLPWVTMLQWSLAELEFQQPSIESNITAKAILDVCITQHISSEGNKRCKHLLAKIEKPEFSMESMKSDGLQKRSIKVMHKNISRLYFRAWKLDLVDTIQADTEQQEQQITDLLATKRADVSWHTDLPETRDYKRHYTYVVPAIEERGYWLIVASDDESFNKNKVDIASVKLNLTGLAAIAKPQEGFIGVTVYQGESGQLVAGATVELWGYGKGRVASVTTDKQGKVKLPKAVGSDEKYFVIVRYKQDSTWVDNPYYTSYHVSNEGEKALIFTDRSIYRPGQDIQWKVMAYQGVTKAVNFIVMPKAKGWVKLFDAHRNEIEQFDVVTNDYGSASGRFTVKSGAALGNWHIETSWGGSQYFTVEEYKRPTFAVTFDEVTRMLRFGETAKITAGARYLFGQPVTEGEVKWRITRTAEPEWKYEHSSSELVASGAAKPDKNGLIAISFVPEPEKNPTEDVAVYRFTATLDFTNSGGETRSANDSWLVGKSGITTDIELPATFMTDGSTHPVVFKRKDLNGSPQSGKAGWVLHRIKQPDAAVLPADIPRTLDAEKLIYATPGDKLNSRWEGGVRGLASFIHDWKDGEIVKQGTVEHDDKGLATVTFDKLPKGLYRLHYSGKDEQGNEFTTEEELLVVSDQTMAISVPLVLEIKGSQAEVGDNVELLVGSGFEDIPVTLDIYHGDEYLRSQVIKGGIRRVNVAVSEAHRGGLFFVVSALKDYQDFSLSQNVSVPWTNRQLDVSFSTFRDKLQPGQKETWRLTVKDPAGQSLDKGMTEVLASMYDKSLDFFSKHKLLSQKAIYPVHYSISGHESSQGVEYQNTFSDRPDPVGPEPLLPARLADLNNEARHSHPAIPTSEGGSIEAITHTHRNGAAKHTHSHSMRKPEEPQLMINLAAPRPVPKPAPLPKVMAMGSYKGPIQLDGVMMQYDDSEALAGAASGTEPNPITVRSNFNETAFFYPHLVLDADGSFSFEFEVPESLTEWKVWATALTEDLRIGSVSESVVTSKDLIVRPYLPRFLREGDLAEIEVVINNAGETDLSGQLDFDIINSETKESLAADFKLAQLKQDFQVRAGQSTSVRFAITVPENSEHSGLIAIRSQATAGKLSDGEQRPLAILPGRMHLMKSRFAVLNDETTKTMSFPDITSDKDSTRHHEKLVVNIEGQLFQSVLNALPYLVDYPYECTEQTLNRYLSTSMVMSVLDKHPTVEALVKQFAERDTQYEQWDSKDANRSVLLEETPWLNDAMGGEQATERLFRILNPEVAAQQREKSLEKLRKAQLSSGGFSWWSGGRASSAMTLYQLQGFARALEFSPDDTDTKDMALKAWTYLHETYKDSLISIEYLDQITMMSYLLTVFPDAEWHGGLFSAADKQQMLDFSFDHRSQLPRFLKAHLALALHRSQRGAEAKRVFGGVMDGVKTDESGTYWGPEKQAWYWLRDTTVSHAFVLRTLIEIAPDDSRRSGLVQWLLLDKKRRHWKSTRATAESIYALLHHLKQGANTVKDVTAIVNVGSGLTKQFVFKADEYTGDNQQLVVDGSDVEPDMANITLSKQGGGSLPMFASATWHYTTEALPTQSKGDLLQVSRQLYKRSRKSNDWMLQSIDGDTDIQVGDQVEVQLSLTVKHAVDYVHLRSPRGAGFEPMTKTSGYQWNAGVGYFEEIRDSGMNYFFDWLPAGKHRFKYRLRATTAGKFRVAPALLQSVYAPEYSAFSNGAEVRINK